MPDSLIGFSRTIAYQNDDSFGYFILMINLAKREYTLSHDGVLTKFGILISDETVKPDAPDSIPAPVDIESLAKGPPAPPPRRKLKRADTSSILDWIEKSHNIETRKVCCQPLTMSHKTFDC